MANTEAMETVKNFMLALEANNLDTVASYLDDAFQFSGWTPQPLGKDDFITVMGGLKEGIPNLIYNFHNLHEEIERDENSRESGVVRMTGVQSEGFILPPLGLPPIPQTQNVLSMPEEEWLYTVQNNRIMLIAVKHAAGGGITGLLHQLGIDVPIVQ